MVIGWKRLTPSLPEAVRSAARGCRGAAACCVALCLLLSVSLTAIASDWSYTLRPGDDLWSIARLQCGSSAFAPRIAAHNAIADPARVRAGRRIQIPVAWLVKPPATVQVLAVTGAASDGAGLALSVGQQLEMGDRVQTGDGFVVVRFADGTELEIGADSDVLFNVLTAHGAAGMVDSQLRIYQGGGNVRVIKQGAASSFRIWTPAGIAAVRGTSFRIGVAANGVAANGVAVNGVASAVENSVDSAASRLETLTGLVDFERAAATTEVPAGTGLVASAAGVVQETLLPAPIVAAASGKTAEDRLEWQSAAGAVAEQVDIFDLSGPVPVLVVSERLNAPGYALSGLTPGSYRAAIRGIAASGLEGFDATLPFTVLAVPPAPASVELNLEPSAMGPAARLQWIGSPGTDYRIRLSTAAGTVIAETVEAARPDAVAGTLEFVTSALPPGTYDVEIEPVANGVNGSSYRETLTVQRSEPWWRSALVAVPLLLLAL